MREWQGWRRKRGRDGGKSKGGRKEGEKEQCLKVGIKKFLLPRKSPIKHPQNLEDARTPTSCLPPPCPATQGSWCSHYPTQECERERERGSSCQPLSGVPSLFIWCPSSMPSMFRSFYFLSSFKKKICWSELASKHRSVFLCFYEITIVLINILHDTNTRTHAHTNHYKLSQLIQY